MPHAELTIFIGSRIRQRRELLGLSQTDVAAQLGMRKSNFSKLEAGHRTIDASDLGILAAFMRVPVEYFYGDDNEVKGDTKYIIDTFRLLSPEIRAVAITQIEALVKHAEVSRENATRTPSGDVK